ncbi:MAG TPA: TonB-dependent receptor plug domain-containing protein [Saprospiraceae bacterium]|nr:TonB-dependent receptor plug domain-containing protein [Saprospiraceae bacterium]MCB9269323.1 TonB-dependent receptor plug domain-containing protein [Lewinellaceae bacterium]HPG08872.1 TonB-dependent receptor plug domain-containing protein [Saprospiraceae bacterium]HPR00234.1 TonB-dependent receptor plug domain-containing protein [Saprospiraceae bacterium]HRV85463.1 TonB-dependent receptor plug domain-containing protein [Saprospiraceae bacterium]
MKQPVFYLLLGAMALFMSCKALKNMPEAEAAPEQVSLAVEPGNSIPLDVQLQKVPGITVQGEGANARIRVRGSASFLGDSEPLFVVNGVPVYGGFRDVFSMVNTAQLKSINVLRNPSDTGIYGTRGANGVVEIKY